MVTAINNPRFPHKVEILKEDIDQNTGDSTPKIVFESECGLRDMVRGIDTEADVLKADYKLAIPKTSYLIKRLDLVRFTHSFTGEVIEGKVEAYRAFNLGCNIWVQSNGYGK